MYRSPVRDRTRCSAGVLVLVDLQVFRSVLSYVSKFTVYTTSAGARSAGLTVGTMLLRTGGSHYHVYMPHQSHSPLVVVAPIKVTVHTTAAVTRDKTGRWKVLRSHTNANKKHTPVYTPAVARKRTWGSVGLGSTSIREGQGYCCAIIIAGHSSSEATARKVTGVLLALVGLQQ